MEHIAPFDKSAPNSIKCGRMPMRIALAHVLKSNIFYFPAKRFQEGVAAPTRYGEKVAEGESLKSNRL